MLVEYHTAAALCSQAGQVAFLMALIKQIMLHHGGKRQHTLAPGTWRWHCWHWHWSRSEMNYTESVRCFFLTQVFYVVLPQVVCRLPSVYFLGLASPKSDVPVLLPIPNFTRTNSDSLHASIPGTQWIRVTESTMPVNGPSVMSLRGLGVAAAGTQEML